MDDVRDGFVLLLEDLVVFFEASDFFAQLLLGEAARAEPHVQLADEQREVCDALAAQVELFAQVFHFAQHDAGFGRVSALELEAVLAVEAVDACEEGLRTRLYFGCELGELGADGGEELSASRAALCQAGPELLAAVLDHISQLT